MTEKAAGTFYGVGVGPGDPELLTLKAARILNSCDYIYVPTSRLSSQGYVEDVARAYAGDGCEVCPVSFSLAASAEQREDHWRETAIEIAGYLSSGHDVALVTLGDALLYSTYIYLLRALREVAPEATVETVPGISSFSLAAALTDTPLGEGKQSLRVIPAVTDLVEVEKAVLDGSTLVLMKIGVRLLELIDLLDRLGALERSVFVARAGLPEQRVETDLRCLRDAEKGTGNLAVIIVQAAEL